MLSTPARARWSLAAAAGLVLLVAPTCGADEPPVREDLIVSNSWVELMPTVPPIERLPVRRMTERPARRPLALPLLYSVSAGLQGFDAYSTLSVLASGGTEANPMMRQVTKSPAAFLAVKAGAVGISVLAAERLWRHDHRLSAILLMVASNGFMTYVAVNNAKAMARR